MPGKQLKAYYCITFYSLVLLSEPVQCYTGFRVFGDMLQQNSQTITQCVEGFSCAGVTANAQINVTGIAIRGKKFKISKLASAPALTIYAFCDYLPLF